MRVALDVAGTGAVTAAGLTAWQTCAAVRASLSGASLQMLGEPLGVEQVAARVPTHWSLRRTPAGWLAHLGARALRECLEGAPYPGGAGRALYLIPPESGRAHPGLDGVAPEALLAEVAGGMAFNAASRVIDGGAAAALGSLAFAAQAIERGEAAEVVILGVDSLINRSDLGRLRAANRLLGPDNAKGMVPGEGAVAIRLVPRGRAGPGAAAILSVATTREPDRVDGPRHSQGRALLEALHGAAGDRERELDWVVSTNNGERYVQWEAVLARARFFRTRRESLPVVCPAMATGDVGSAAAGLCLLVAADAFGRGHAPGRVALCEATSEGGLRSAAVIGRAA